jgi:hypothetical protein
MRYETYKDNFMSIKDFRYRYLIGFYEDGVVIFKYNSRGQRIARFDVGLDLTLALVKNYTNYPITIDREIAITAILSLKQAKEESSLGATDTSNNLKPS